jgi:tartrate-resistant acid phosphatase type 5
VSKEIQNLRISNQLNHIINVLESTRQDPPSWLIMLGHYPIYSPGSHGDTSELVEYIEPLMAKYKIDAYISGHDHISSHLVKDNTHYFIAGGGAM